MKKIFFYKYHTNKILFPFHLKTNIIGLNLKIFCNNYYNILKKSIYYQNNIYINNIYKFFSSSKNVYGSYSDNLNLSSGTIYSLSTCIGKSAIAVIRISGPKSSKALTLLTGNKKIPEPRKAILRNIYDPETNEKLDNALVLWFPSPNSFTGEDVVELHLHGGKAVIYGTLLALSKIEGLSTAKPGEFTRRAFENGKLDLTEVEGLDDLINAETEAQRKQALRQMNGELSKLYSNWRNELLKSLAKLEALIDFGEDEEISEEIINEVVPIIKMLINDISSHLNDGRKGERLRDGANISIIGPPNAGKSSLLNILANRQAAIVSEIPGTTRDIIEVTLNFAGYPVIIGDTAGIRISSDIIEQEGIKRAKERFQISDLKICVLDAKELIKNDIEPLLNELINQETIIVLNKEDQLENNIIPIIKQNLKKNKNINFDKIWILSCKTGKGIPEFLKGLEKEVKICFENISTNYPMITRVRHRENLEQCLKYLKQFLVSLNLSEIVISCEELRNAIQSIGRITGRVDVEEVLDIIFQTFCIGK